VQESEVEEEQESRLDVAAAASAAHTLTVKSTGRCSRDSHTCANIASCSVLILLMFYFQKYIYTCDSCGVRSSWTLLIVIHGWIVARRQSVSRCHLAWCMSWYNLWVTERVRAVAEIW